MCYAGTYVLIAGCVYAPVGMQLCGLQALATIKTSVFLEKPRTHEASTRSGLFWQLGP